MVWICTASHVYFGIFPFKHRLHNSSRLHAAAQPCHARPIQQSSVCPSKERAPQLHLGSGEGRRCPPGVGKQSLNFIYGKRWNVRLWRPDDSVRIPWPCSFCTDCSFFIFFWVGVHGWMSGQVYMTCMRVIRGVVCERTSGHNAYYIYLREHCG